jgi:hypothetical protein
MDEQRLDPPEHSERAEREYDENTTDRFDPASQDAARTLADDKAIIYDCLKLAYEHAQDTAYPAMCVEFRHGMEALARLARAPSPSGEELREFVARVAEPGPRTGEDARDWQRDAASLLSSSTKDGK